MAVQKDQIPDLNMTMIKTYILLLSVGLLPMAAIAVPLYELDMNSDQTDDFNLRVQMGRLGGDNFNNIEFSYQANTYLYQGRYGNGVGLSLNQGGSGGVYSGDTVVGMSFTYSGTTDGGATLADPSNTLVGLWLRGSKGGDSSDTYTSNTYPLYYSTIREGVFSIVKKWAYDNTTGQSTVASYTLETGEISSSDTYYFEFGTFDQGSNVSLQASLYQDGSLVNTLNYLDDGSVGPAAFSSGYIGVIASQSGFNNIDFMGVEISGFTVDTVAIPEPSSLVLVLISGLTGALYLRKQRKG